MDRKIQELQYPMPVATDYSVVLEEPLLQRKGWMAAETAPMHCCTEFAAAVAEPVVLQRDHNLAAALAPVVVGRRYSVAVAHTAAVVETSWCRWCSRMDWLQKDLAEEAVDAHRGFQMDRPS